MRKELFYKWKSSDTSNGEDGPGSRPPRMGSHATLSEENSDTTHRLWLSFPKDKYKISRKSGPWVME
jgi:hypothetical protein